ncbi:hypothetical protein IQ07DRAFT_593108 [Pyrenochaeta sp. DS3sAY3a]|nr:hypothetical protein IQ07DRAFT_593108 [Pyrenochaeta sp. DS3sAY3a]
MPAPTAALTSSFNEARSPLTAANVQAWASDHFPDPLQALPRPSRVKWIQFDDDSFTVTRAVWRGIGRSAHNHLLVIGGYAPGPEPEVEEPTERVAAHVHADEADVSFFRITANNELLPVKSTSTVAFHAPFCDVGDDAGNSKAIHRVSALILYYFLAAGHVTELQRTRADPSMFTRTFRDACYWVANNGERPNIPHPRPNAVPRSSALVDDVPVRPKRSSTMTSLSSTSFTTDPAPPIRRAATDDVKIKRDREDDAILRPKKHPRRTLSEQIVIPSLRNHDTTLSPRSPAPERVNRALSDRIEHLKDENADLKHTVSSLEHDRAKLEKRLSRRAYELEKMSHELNETKRRLSNVEIELDALKRRFEHADKDTSAFRLELLALRKTSKVSNDASKEV